LRVSGKSRELVFFAVAGRALVEPGMTRERSLQLLADDDQPNAEFVVPGSCARS